MQAEHTDETKKNLATFIGVPDVLPIVQHKGEDEENYKNNAELGDEN